jgi:hypothetical protein
VGDQRWGLESTFNHGRHTEITRGGVGEFLYHNEKLYGFSSDHGLRTNYWTFPLHHCKAPEKLTKNSNRASSLSGSSCMAITRSVLCLRSGDIALALICPDLKHDTDIGMAMHDDPDDDDALLEFLVSFLVSCNDAEGRSGSLSANRDLS